MNAAQRAALQAALNLRYPSFPCRPDKKPATAHGFKDAALPEAGLATLWTRNPGELIGVPTGEATGVDVLDVDPKNGGRDWYEAHRGRLPPTRIHRTKSGGLHVLFQHLSGLRNSTCKIATGIDVRADGGYVIWWPAAGLEVRDLNLAEWPTWLLPALMDPPVPPLPVYPRRAPGTGGAYRQLEGILRVVAQASVGERNSRLYWAACRVWEMTAAGAAPAASVEVLAQVAAHCGLAAREIKRTLASAGLPL